MSCGPFSDRREDGVAADPSDAKTIKKLFHRAVVGHQDLVVIYRDRKMSIADFEGESDCMFDVAHFDGDHRFRRRFDFEVPVAFDGQHGART